MDAFHSRGPAVNVSVHSQVASPQLSMHGSNIACLDGSLTWLAVACLEASQCRFHNTLSSKLPSAWAGTFFRATCLDSSAIVASDRSIAKIPASTGVGAWPLG